MRGHDEPSRRDKSLRVPSSAVAFRPAEGLERGKLGPVEASVADPAQCKSELQEEVAARVDQCLTVAQFSDGFLDGHGWGPWSVSCPGDAGICGGFACRGVGHIHVFWCSSLSVCFADLRLFESPLGDRFRGQRLDAPVERLDPLGRGEPKSRLQTGAPGSRPAEEPVAYGAAWGEWDSFIEAKQSRRRDVSHQQRPTEENLVHFVSFGVFCGQSGCFGAHLLVGNRAWMWPWSASTFWVKMS
jgi:hypothetical protein